jgi:hypothetical protein
MASLLQNYHSIFSHAEKNTSLSSSYLTDHDEMGKQNALDAVDILIRYKTTVHDFTDEIVGFWPLPRRVMDRYHFDDSEELNEWLDSLS